MNRDDLRIMVVNDKLELRAVIRDYLKAEGYSRLIVSENGLSALKRAEEFPPDLIIADLELPGLTGLELLRNIRRLPHLEQTPFILLSPESAQAQVAEAAEARVSALLLKPFTHQALADKVRTVLEHRLNPSQGESLAEEASRLAEAGDIDGALALYQEALEATRRTMALVHYKIGGLHERMDRPGDAERDYQDALGMSAVFVDAMDALGDMAMSDHRPEEALEQYRSGIAISPRNAARQFRLGEALLAVGRNESAEKAFKEALELDPTQTHVFNRLGISLRRQEKLAEAAEVFLRALETTPHDEHLLYNLSRVHADQGDRKNAVRFLRQALEINPDFVEARQLLDSWEAKSTGA